MNFEECVAFCESRKHVTSHPIYEGVAIARIVPAPTSSTNPGTYFKALYKINFDYNTLAKRFKAAQDYEPYILLDDPAVPMGLFGWYFQEFPDDKPVAE